jgi:hypothetical protein
MTGLARFMLISVAFAGGVALAAAAGFAGGIAPGLWRITSRTETGGVIGPPHESSRCFSAKEANDVVATFVPPVIAENSNCAPVEHSLQGGKLIWRLACRGQTDMEQSGEFIFDSPRHYTATLRTRAAVSGATMVDSQDTLEGQWVSECR